MVKAWELNFRSLSFTKHTLYTHKAERSWYKYLWGPRFPLAVAEGLSQQGNPRFLPKQVADLSSIASTDHREERTLCSESFGFRLPDGAWD